MGSEMIILSAESYSVSAAIIMKNGGRSECFLLDCGKGTLSHTKNNGNLKILLQIRHVLLSHGHKDHAEDMGKIIAAIDQQLMGNREKREIYFHGPESIIDKAIDRMERPSSDAGLIPINKGGRHHNRIFPFLVEHVTGRPCYGFLVNAGSEIILYSGDFGPKTEWGRILDNLPFWPTIALLEATRGTGKDNDRHIGLATAIKIFEEMEIEEGRRLVWHVRDKENIAALNQMAEKEGVIIVKTGDRFNFEM